MKLLITKRAWSRIVISMMLLSASIGSGVASCDPPIQSRGHMSTCLNASCNSEVLWVCAVGQCWASLGEMANGCFPRNGESCTLFGCYSVYGCYSCW